MDVTPLSPRRIIVHHVSQIDACLVAADRLGVTPTLQTAKGAVKSAGVSYLYTMAESSMPPKPGMPFYYVLDCGDYAGIAMAALRTGFKTLLFTGDPETREKIRSMATPLQAVLVDPASEVLDLLYYPDPVQAAISWLSESELPQRAA